MNYKIFYRLTLIALLFVLLCCDLPTQPGPQPKDITETSLEPGLNIFGVIRLEEQKQESFVYIEKALPTDEYYQSLDDTIKNANVEIWQENDTSRYFFKINPAQNNARYTNQSFIPVAEKTYHVSASANTEQGLLSASGSTVVPPVPDLARDSTTITDNYLKVNSTNSQTINRWDLIVYYEDQMIAQQVFYDQINFPVTFNLEQIPVRPTKLEIIAHDENLATYLQASNALFPQTYREDISTVDEGYGCFGAISVKNISLGE
ncbi:MAG: hypothetical protein K9M80_07125 [Candidatus Marinimicrobia bacterium]|nr:hypothetical protein [Candidatus Neomarinimicrobiota bacterium]